MRTDRLDPASWLPYAKKLQAGRQARLDHDCGTGRTLTVHNKGDHYSAWCFRCNAGGFEPGPRESLKDRIARLTAEKAADAQIEASAALPAPRNLDPRTWPLQARVWLYKAGFDNDAIINHQFYYHEKTARVVMPVYEDNTVSYWQARGFRADLPKYLNPVTGIRPLAKYEQPPVVGQELVLVLTEDLLSACRVADAGVSAWCLLGTALTPKARAALSKETRRVLVWLDPDEAGLKGADKIKRALAPLGVRCSIIRSEKDPKLYSKEAILSHLNLQP